MKKRRLFDANVAQVGDKRTDTVTAKTLIVGDMHCKQGVILPLVDKAVATHGASKVVFLGDYADEWNSTAKDVVDALGLQARWAEAARGNGIGVTFLIGNHDFEYLLGEGCSGTHLEAMADIREALGRIELRVATCVDGYLVTHAGLTQEWADEYFAGSDGAKAIVARLNEMLLGGSYHDWTKLASCGSSRGGVEIASPLWADKRDLKNDAAHGLSQIAGHTPTKTCERIRRGEDEIWLCDTFSLASNMIPIGDGSMLLVQDGAARRIKTDWGSFRG